MTNENSFEAIWINIYDALYSDITGLIIPPGFVLSEAKLAEKYHVSRSPVKSALDKLSADGLVEKLPNGTRRVLPLDSQEAINLYNVRVALEGIAASLAAKNISAEDLQALKENVDSFIKIEASMDYSAFAELDQQFHNIIVRAGKNPYIIEMHKSIEPRILRYRCYMIKTKAIMSIKPYRNHIAIYNAIRQGYSDIAKSEMEHDINWMIYGGNVCKSEGETI